MNWKTYIGMTKEQRVEYDFRFKHKPIVFNFNGMIPQILLLFMMSVNMVLVTFLIITNDMFESLRYQIQDYLVSAGMLVNMTFYIILFFFISWLINLIVRGFMEYWWIKKNHIKVYKIWSKKKNLK